MSVPSAVSQIMARIADVSQMSSFVPAAVGQLEDRFAARLDAATTNATSPTRATSTTSSAGAISRSGGTLQTARIDRSGVGTARWASSSAGGSGDTAAAIARSLPASGTGSTVCPNARGKALTPAIQAAATKYGLDPAFLAAVFWTESSVHPRRRLAAPGRSVSVS